MNRLSAESSAYLRSAAHQPVHWHSWGEEAFAAARERARPVLLDIGAVWCHWCHVMDGESYEDPHVAGFLNENFVCVKVDRDERPDVDARYQRAVQALAGQGGWPLTAFLTGDGEVFYGGTYFPPDGKYGRPGFMSVLAHVSELYRSRRESVAATARELADRLASSLVEAVPGELSPAVLEQGAERLARLFDWRYGGFGTAPKFPHPSAVEFLLARWWDSRAPWLLEVVQKTLDGMARGGFHDQLGGGFHRYSVDERWCVPHFEKMASDNAELLRVYLRACAALGTPRYRETAEGVVSWLLDVMAEPGRASFASSQDADNSPGDDGDYYTWTAEEAASVLDADEWDVAHRRWDIYARGEMHHAPERNVLWVARSLEAIAQETERDAAAVRDLLESARAKLLQARRTRPEPFVDRTEYVSSSAMLAEALLEAAAVLERGDCSAAALAVLRRLRDEAFVRDRGMTHAVGRGAGPWLLEDQVHAASAFLAAFEHTGERAWLDDARDLTDLTLSGFWDGARGGFFDTMADGEATGFLRARAKPIQDAPSASPNATAALVLLRLSAITGEAGYAEHAERLLAAFAGTAAELGLHASTYLRALDWHLRGACRVQVADSEGNRELHQYALRHFRPRKVVVPEAASPLPEIPVPVALVCAGTACAAPVSDRGALRETLETFSRAR